MAIRIIVKISIDAFAFLYSSFEIIRFNPFIFLPPLKQGLLIKEIFHVTFSHKVSR